MGRFLRRISRNRSRNVSRNATKHVQKLSEIYRNPSLKKNAVETMICSVENQLCAVENKIMLLKISPDLYHKSP